MKERETELLLEANALPPCFSNCLIMQLKSLIINQGLKQFQRGHQRKQF